MNFIPSTIKGMFDTSITFTIPVYQRAYSWEKENWTAFFDDIAEQSVSGNGYSFGNLLLETVKEDDQYEIIDGQQRLTTLVIFMRAMIDTLRTNGDGSEEVEDLIECLGECFLKRKSVIKLRPVEYDRTYFNSVIVDGNDSLPPVSKSQECMRDAKLFFTNRLKGRSPGELKNFSNVVLTSNINRLTLQGKRESALMFELQNNRGRELTNLEKLKSYFMYQMYVYSSPEETDANVELISDFFKDIYTTIHDIRGLEEDRLLIYHCQAYLKKTFGYRNLEDIKSELESSDDKVNWIKEFARELTCTFRNMKELQTSNVPYYLKLKSMGMPAFVYPFIIKGMHFFRGDDIKLDALCHILEILSFRYYLINSKAEINGRLTDSLRKFDGDVIRLRDSLKVMMNESWYWSDTRAKKYLEGYMFGNRVLRYILWQYEDSLQRAGYNVVACEVTNEQIEHISPQVPPSGQPLAVGYDVDEDNAYSDEFKENELNSIGNLMLISGSHNASIGNRPFFEKLLTYEENPVLRQQAEISSFLTEGKPEWKAEQIDRRREKIVSFAVKRWDFDTVQYKY